ncbi:MAG: rhomboid family intramembrane serine protease [Bernardetiaceae bacterium]|jgi:membrane associated rhomboid family serine protease|nr:rhomboid family intramembrane serine protease [Bernardetiaceae bacterium]
MFQLTPVVRNLLLINVAVFVIEAVGGYNFADLFGLRYPLASQFAPHQIITHMFVHAGVGHLFSNMLSLAIFGPMLEQYWGGRRFLTFYLVCGLGASLLHTLVNAYEIHQAYQMVEQHTASLSYAEKDQVWDAFNRMANTPMVGASGAIFGLLMAFGMMFPEMEIFMMFFPVPIKAKYMVWIWGGLEIFSVLKAAPNDNVAHFAHLGGMLFAYFMIKSWRRRGEI